MSELRKLNMSIAFAEKEFELAKKKLDILRQARFQLETTPEDSAYLAQLGEAAKYVKNKSY